MGKLKGRGKAKGVDVKRHNPKAFTFSGGVNSVHRRVQRTAEIQDKKLKVQKVVKRPESPPPFIVVVQGPPETGKSTLIRSLVKHYTRRNITNLSGPITVVSSKSRRLTFIECQSQMQYMLDASKIADLVIILIDASFGYEMDTFEFINILQTHGFPRVIGVLTHLDKFNNDKKTVRKCKNQFKKRFWTEIYDGAKLFFLSKIKNNRYDKVEISNLARFISVQKPVNLSWRTSHPYTLSLRHEYIDNIIYFYGYVYGARFVIDQPIHIPGAGDFKISSIQDCIDPCPIPTIGKRTLQDKQRGIYAPGCDIGMVMLDDEDMYITLPNVKTHFTPGISNEENITDAVRMVRELQSVNQPLTSSDFKLTTDSANFHQNDVNDVESSDDSSENGDDSSDDSSENGDDSSEKNDDKPISIDPFIFKPKDSGIDFQCSELMRLIYKHPSGDLLGADLTDLARDNDLIDPNLPDERIFDMVLKNNTFDELIESESVKCLFKFGDEEENEEDNNGDIDDNDLKNGDFQNSQVDDFQYITKRQRLQEELEQAEYMETCGFKGMESQDGNFIGKYVKIGVSNIPKSWYDRVKESSSMVIIGGLLHGESNFGHTLIRIKRHRWAPKILKNEDPILFSIGWRRFQSLPLYCMEDRNKVRVRMLKYTPEHLHCLAVIYGPLAPPNTGVIGIKNWAKIKSYRISLSGVVLGEASDVKVVKKLKLIGEAHKIYKNTAFIKGMFNSSLEASKCIGAKIQTVSGIRGIIKKVDKTEGIFRASFEDKIVPSDVIIMKSYVQVQPKSVYNPILDEGGSRIRSILEIKSSLGISPSSGHPYPLKSSLVHPVKKLSTIKVPSKLVKTLPFQSRPKKISQDNIKSIPIVKSEEEKRSARVFNKLLAIRRARREKRAEKMRLYKAKTAIESSKSDEVREAKLREKIKKRSIKESKKQSVLRDKLAID